MQPNLQLVAALLLSLVSPFQGAGAGDPDLRSALAAAASKLQAGDARGAVEILAPLSERAPRNGFVWRRLGLARHAARDYDGASEAFEHALEVEPGNVGPLYSLAVARAMAGDVEEAFGWLEQARDSGKIDMTQMEFDTRLASLQGDPRLAALRPGPEVFERPFVEPVQVLHEWRGEAPNDQFGWIARRLGDVDGDGVADVVTSAPTHGAGSEGRVYVYSTKRDACLWTADGNPGDTLGIGVECAGDVNADGIPDVIASAPGGNWAKVYSGRDGRVLLSLSGEKPGDNYGRHAAGVGDVDGDGCSDVIVGAPGNSAGGAGAGRAYVYSGKDGHPLLVLTGEAAGDAFGSAVGGLATEKGMLLVVGAGSAGPRRAGRAYVYDALGQRAHFTIEADDTGGALAAMFVGVPGDVDGDGTNDVFVSDWMNSALGPQTGRVYVHSGKDGKRVFALTGQEAGDGFGSSHAIAGDVDGDGHADLVVGAWQFGGGAVGAGRCDLISGKSGRSMATYTCRTPGDAFGFDGVALGDVNGDGTSDLLITSAWSGVRGYHSGRVFVISSGIAPAKR